MICSHRLKRLIIRHLYKRVPSSKPSFTEDQPRPELCTPISNKLISSIFFVELFFYRLFLTFRPFYLVLTETPIDLDYSLLHLVRMRETTICSHGVVLALQ